MNTWHLKWRSISYPICIKNLFCKIILNDYKLSTVRARLICNIRQVDVLIELEDERSKGNLYPGKRTPNTIGDDGEDLAFRIMTFIHWVLMRLSRGQSPGQSELNFNHSILSDSRCYIKKFMARTHYSSTLNSDASCTSTGIRETWFFY